MPLTLDAEQRMLAETCKGFLEDAAPVAQLRALRDARDPDGFSRDLWKRFAEMGFTGILAPESDGGLGLGPVEAGIVSTQIGHCLTASPFLSTAVLGVTALVAAGSAEQRARWLTPMIAGDLLAALAVDEGPRHRPEGFDTTARRRGNGFVLNGLKKFVVDAPVAGLLLVVATLDEAPAIFALEAGTSGLAIDRQVMLDSHSAGRLTLEEVSVDADALLGDPKEGAVLLQRILDAGRAAVAAELTGVATESFNRTLAYLRERRQFGRAIGEFQGLQHRAAQLHCEIEVTKAVVLKAAQQLGEGSDQSSRLVSVAKARAGATAALAVQEAVQMHGGVGMTDEYDIGLFMKRARGLDVLFGDAAFQADRLARAHGY